MVKIKLTNEEAEVLQLLLEVRMDTLEEDIAFFVDFENCAEEYQERSEEYVYCQNIAHKIWEAKNGSKN